MKKRATLLAFVLLIAAACGKSASTAGGPRASSGVPEKDVTFKTSDGVTLTGRLFGSGPVGVTLAHQRTADATSWYPSARKLAAAGYMALAFNFRGYGTSKGRVTPLKEPLDLVAAREYLRHIGATTFAYLGASMGGTASLVAAVSGDALCIVAVSAPERFAGLDAVVASSKVQRPVLLLASRGDSVAFDSLQHLAVDLPNPDTAVFDGNAHGTDLLDSRPEAIDRILTFLKRYAPIQTPTPAPT